MRLSVHIVFSKVHKNVRRVEFDRSPSPLPVNTDGIIIVGCGAKDVSIINVLDRYDFLECLNH